MPTISNSIAFLTDGSDMIGNPNLLIGNIALNLDRIKNAVAGNAAPSNHIKPTGSNPINIQAVNAKCQDQDPDCAIVIQRMAHAIAQITATILATRNKQDRLFDSTQVAFILWDTLDQHVI